MDSNHKSTELTLDPEISYGEFQIGEDIAKYMNLVEKEEGEYISTCGVLAQV